MNYATLHNPFMPDDSFRIIQDDSIEPGLPYSPETQSVALRNLSSILEGLARPFIPHALVRGSRILHFTQCARKLSALGVFLGAVNTRYNGPAHWVLSDAAKVQSFFVLRFNHALPISAFGQTAVHDHLGFDHHNAMDVAESPDSSEGQALMAYLRSAGIPFIAFRYAVTGSATGAHIHIGYPSHRISK